jgi:hypothetical protein
MTAEEPVVVPLVTALLRRMIEAQEETNKLLADLSSSRKETRGGERLYQSCLGRIRARHRPLGLSLATGVPENRSQPRQRPMPQSRSCHRYR